MKKMKNKNTLFSRIARFYSGIETRARWYIWGAAAGTTAGLFFLIFEPFNPWHAPCVFLFFGTALWCAAGAAHRCGYRLLPEMWKWISSHKKITAGVCTASVLIYMSVLFVPLGRSPFKGLSPDELDRKIQADYMSVCDSIPEMDRVIRGFRAQSGLLKKRDIENITMDEKRAVMRLWGECARIIREYDKGVDIYRFFYRIPYVSQPVLHFKAFYTGYICFVSRYAFGSELIHIVGNNPVWETMLNEGVPEQGIPPDFYNLLKYNIIHVNDVIRLAAGYGHLSFLARVMRNEDFFANREEMLEYIKGCVVKSTKRIAGKSLTWFPKNGIDIFKRKTFDVWFPIQKKAARTMGHIRFTGREANYISAEQLKEFKRGLRPGDILVERRNWYMSNLGIPGFWPHAGRKILTANSIVQAFDEQFPTADAQLDFSGFLDYDPVRGCVTNGTADDLRKSWKRTKWDILLE